MNIFYIHKDPSKAAQALIDVHVNKMILESAQLLSTCHRIVDGIHYIDSSSGRRLQKWRHPDPVLDEKLYKSTHFNHPCALWLRESAENYDWLYEHFIALGQEYEKRYGKTHASITKLADVLKNRPAALSSIGFTTPAQAMDAKYQVDGAPLIGYYNYYIAEKLPLGNAKDKQRFMEFLRDEYHHDIELKGEDYKV